MAISGMGEEEEVEAQYCHRESDEKTTEERVGVETMKTVAKTLE